MPEHGSSSEAGLGTGAKGGSRRDVDEDKRLLEEYDVGPQSRFVSQPEINGMGPGPNWLAPRIIIVVVVLVALAAATVAASEARYSITGVLDDASRAPGNRVVLKVVGHADPSGWCEVDTRSRRCGVADCRGRANSSGPIYVAAEEVGLTEM